MGESAEGTTATQPRLSLTLRDGGTCTLYADRIVIGSPEHPQEYPLADLARAELVVDPHVAQTPGAPPPPAVLLRLRDGRDVLLSPAEAPAAWQLLGAIFAARPELRPAATGAYPPPPSGAPFPPGYSGFAGYAPGYGPAYMPGYAPGYGPGYGPGYAPGYGPGYGPGYVPPGVARPSSNDTVLAGLSHLGVFLGGWLLPLIIWLATRNSAPYASRQAKQAFFWQLLFFVLFIVAYFGFIAVFFTGFFTTFATTPYSPGTSPSPGPFTFASFGALFVFYGILLVGSIINIVFSIIGAVQAFQGKPFHYPLLGRL